MKDVSIVIQTCDKYDFLWESWYYYFRKHWDFSIPRWVFFCSEKKGPKFESTPDWTIGEFQTGVGSWGKRLLRILDFLPDQVDTVFYMQEDFWLHRTLPSHVFESRYKTFKEWDMNAYRCCPNSKHFKFVGKHPPRLYAPDSPYILTHQASFWKKDFLRSCVLPHEDPWENEKKGTKRLQGTDHKVYFAPYNFYHTVCQKGKLTGLGRELDAEAKA